MSRTGVFYDILSTIFERRFTQKRLDDGRALRELCQELLTSKGEVSGYRLGQAILDRFDTLSDDDAREFFQFLTDELDVDPDRVLAATEAYKLDRSAENLDELIHASEPTRQTLLRRVNQVPNATVQLVRMREKLLSMARKEESFRRADLDFQHLFASWFNRGFLVLRRIDWQSPASILQKIIQYEAVHAIDDWDDLRRRVQPEDRRCYAFFHPSMPDDPLIFVEVALCKGIPNSVQGILASERDVLEAETADTAVFYSISNCQKGLRGVSFGNSLIKQVVQDLKIELPHLKTAVTLSPLPLFSDWLESESMNGKADETWDDETVRMFAANYLFNAKDDEGKPLDPVARFHLNNGALIHELHANADTSEKGYKQSKGVMVNYLYDLGQVEQNHEDYASQNQIAVSRAVKSLVSKAMKQTKE